VTGDGQRSAAFINGVDEGRAGYPLGLLPSLTARVIFFDE
jgi:hypothetical protein